MARPLRFEVLQIDHHGSYDLQSVTLLLSLLAGSIEFNYSLKGKVQSVEVCLPPSEKFIGQRSDSPARAVIAAIIVTLPESQKQPSEKTIEDLLRNVIVFNCLADDFAISRQDEFVTDAV